MKIFKYQQTHSYCPCLCLGGMMFMTEESKVKVNAGNLNSLKEKLMAVTSEIDEIKTSFAKSTEELSRIQNLLSADQVGDISGIIEKYESRVAEAEQQKMEAADGAKKYSEELEKEKERLIKLWDAYKNQEEELSNKENKLNDYEERVRTAEATKKQIEDDYSARINTLEQKIQENESKVSQFDEYKQKCDDFDNIRNNLEQELHTLKSQNTEKENQIHQLNSELENLRQMENYEEYKTKYEEVTAEYEKEKERLTKLYQLYEETDAECKRLQQENHKWQNWYNTKMEAFNQLFSNAPPSTNTIPPEQPIDNPTTKKPKKKKLKIRK